MYCFRPHRTALESCHTQQLPTLRMDLRQLLSVPIEFCDSIELSYRIKVAVLDLLYPGMTVHILLQLINRKPEIWSLALHILGGTLKICIWAEATSCGENFMNVGCQMSEKGV